jgi:diaminohydroxyphosphoribosylaminopyrimidine deaminase / 5-amino-6-(5-phosphoribosylamino)uracil reductase
MAIDSRDEQFLCRALELARSGIGLASPNPYVGAVITDYRGNVVGEGTYTYAGTKHAEILALETAGQRAHRGTLYINLEPHAHQGRTPPCTDALIAAGIQRVVASMTDPNPKVSGRGFEQLRAAGVEVEVGGLREEASQLNEAFARYIRTGVPFVTLKSAMSLDGKIAPARNTSPRDGEANERWITGETARADVQELRHRHDAILVGIGTVLADDPVLTDRSGKPRRRTLLRVILDSQLRLPLDSCLVKTAAKNQNHDLLVFCSSDAYVTLQEKRAALSDSGVRVEPISSADGRLNLHAAMLHLARLEITSVMIEGGSSVNAAALAAKSVDKMCVYYAPKVLGERAIPFSCGSEFTPVCMRNVHLRCFGDDFAVEGYLRDPYE